MPHLHVIKDNGNHRKLQPRQRRSPARPARTNATSSWAFPASAAKHLRLLTVMGDTFVEDLGSRNGTYVNGKLARKCALNDGDVLQVGKVELRYEKEPANDHAAHTQDPDATTVLTPGQFGPQSQAAREAGAGIEGTSPVAHLLESANSMQPMRPAAEIEKPGPVAADQGLAGAFLTATSPAKRYNGGMNKSDLDAPSRHSPETHQRGHQKVSRIPVKVEPTREMPRKPKWIRARVPSGPGVTRIKRILRERGLSSVCEEGQCPNLGECFSHGTATFMIMGDICTRRCPFCDVAHGKPQALDPDEPAQLAAAIAEMTLKYVVITSVDRDDLRDGGAGHFARLHRGGTQPSAGHHHRSPGTRLPRTHAGGAGCIPGRPAGHLQPQPRDRAPALPQGPSRRRLPVVRWTCWRASANSTRRFPPSQASCWASVKHWTR